MRHFFKSLKTIVHDPRILRETWDKEVNFPEAYWRTEICVFFLLKHDRTELPRALQFNFCPLFWFSNLLLLTSLIWFPVYKLCQLFSFLCEKLVFDNIDKMIAWKTVKRREREQMEEHILNEKIRSTKFDPNNPNYPLLEDGERWIVGSLWTSGALNESVHDEDGRATPVLDHPQVNWNHPDLIKFCTISEAYYVDFRRRYKEDWKQKLQDLRIKHEAEEEERYRQLRLAMAASSAKQVELNKLYASIFKWSKIICKAILFVVAVPVIAFVAVLCYKAAIWLYFAIGYVYWLWFVQNLHVTLNVIGSVASILIVGTAIFLTIQTGFLKALLVKSCNLLAPAMKKLAVPALWLLDKVCDGFAFVFNFLRMFYTSNCPGIKYPEEK